MKIHSRKVKSAGKRKTRKVMSRKGTGGKHLIKQVIDKLLSPITKPITHALFKHPVEKMIHHLRHPKGGRVSTKAEVEKANKKFSEKYNKKFGERDLLRQDEALLEELDFERVKDKERQATLKKSKLLQSNPKLREAYMRTLNRENKAKYAEDIALKKAKEEEKLAQKMQFKSLEEELQFWKDQQKQAEKEGDYEYENELQKTINDIEREIEVVRRNKPTFIDEAFNVATRGLIEATKYIPVVGNVVSKGAEKLYDVLPKKEYKYDAIAKKVANVGVSKLASTLGSARHHIIKGCGEGKRKHKTMSKKHSKKISHHLLMGLMGHGEGKRKHKTMSKKHSKKISHHLLMGLMGHGEGRKHSVKHRARSLSMVAFGEGRKRVRMHSRVGGEMKASYNANIHNGGRKVKKAKREMSHAQQMYQDKLKMIRKKHNLSFKDALKHYAKLKHTV